MNIIRSPAGLTGTRQALNHVQPLDLECAYAALTHLSQKNLIQNFCKEKHACIGDVRT